MKDNRRGLVKLLMRYLCTSEEEDDKLTAFLQIHTHLTLGNDDDEDDAKEQLRL